MAGIIIKKKSICAGSLAAKGWEVWCGGYMAALEDFLAELYQSDRQNYPPK